jgi:hypothetical protein
MGHLELVKALAGDKSNMGFFAQTPEKVYFGNIPPT